MNEVSIGSRSLLAGGALVVAVGGAISGTMSLVVTLVCAVSLPVTFLWGARWSPRVSGAVGLAHLLLLADILGAVHDHDLRFALADALLAVAGLHASRMATRRDHGVALGIQLTVLMCGLSQVPSTTNGTIGTLLWVAAWMSQSAPQLRALRGDVGARDDSRAAQRRGSVALIGVLVVAALLWSVIPIPSLQAPRSLLNQSSSFATSGATSPAKSAAATPGIDRVGDTTMNLNARGSGTNTPVLLARGSPGLLRGEIFDSYDGTSFSRTASSTKTLIGDQQVVLPASAGDVSSHSVQEITLIQAQASVLSVGQPLQVGLSQPATSDGLGDVDVSQSIPAGSNYATVGGTPGPSAHASQTPADQALWLQLPAELPPRVRDLATTWTMGTATPAAEVAAIESHMGQTLKYDLNSPVAPSGADAVDDVLFTSHRGFCEQFAASETVLLRSLGIPARVIGGFAEGLQEDGGAYLVTDSDAHAWVEYWAPGAGWITTDPTANVPLASPAAQSLRERIRHDLAEIPWFCWVIGAACILLLVLAIRRFRRRRVLRTALAGPRGGAELVSPGPVRSAFADLAAAGAIAGTPMRGTETPGDYLIRVPGGWARHEEILPALERELWGPAPPPDASSDRAVAALRELSAELRSGVPV